MQYCAVHMFSGLLLGLQRRTCPLYLTSSLSTPSPASLPLFLPNRHLGEPGERSRVLARLSAVLHVVADRVRVAALYDLWTSVYSYATILVPSLLTAPR